MLSFTKNKSIKNKNVSNKGYVTGANTVKSKTNNNDNGRLSVQEWMPIKDVNNNFIYRRDNFIIAALEIEPINLSLLSENEKKRTIKGLHEVINGLRSYMQIYCIGRPVDLDGYINGLERKMEQTDDYIKKSILKGYIKQAATMASGGETLERKFYMLFVQENDNNSEIELDNRIRELSTNLAGTNLKSHPCVDSDLINLLFLFTHPAQASYERGPLSSGSYLPPQYLDNFKEEV